MRTSMAIMMKSLSILCALTLFAATSFAGAKDGGGGGSPEALFHDMARKFEIAVAELQISEFKSPGAQARLKQVVDGIRLVPSNVPLELAGEPKDAINYPDTLVVEFYVGGWKTLPRAEQYRLVIHELLGLMRIPDPGYRVSTLLSEKTISFVYVGVNPSPVPFVEREFGCHSWSCPHKKEIIWKRNMHHSPDIYAWWPKEMELESHRESPQEICQKLGKLSQTELKARVNQKLRKVLVAWEHRLIQEGKDLRCEIVGMSPLSVEFIDNTTFKNVLFDVAMLGKDTCSIIAKDIVVRCFPGQ